MPWANALLLALLLVGTGFMTKTYCHLPLFLLSSIYSLSFSLHSHLSPLTHTLTTTPFRMCLFPCDVFIVVGDQVSPRFSHVWLSHPCFRAIHPLFAPPTRKTCMFSFYFLLFNKINKINKTKQNEMK
jgi:hypothetical protein